LNLTGAAAAAASAIKMVLAAPRFAWFGDPASTAAPAAAGAATDPQPEGGSAPPAPALVEPESRSGLFRRTPGSHFAEPPAREPAAAPAAQAPVGAMAIDRDPESERAAADAFSAGFARGTAAVPGLVRRRPGAQLDRVVSDKTDELEDRTVPIAPIERDPEAERRAVDRFLVGYDRGVDATATVPVAAAAASPHPAPHEEHDELERA
jgi:hypothetical protein